MTRLRYALLLIVLFGAAALLYFSFTREKVPAAIELAVPSSSALGQEIRVPLRISTTVPMNAAEFYFSFPEELVEVKRIDRADSFFALWIKDQPAFNNETGELSFAGGLPKPGFVGEDGLVATVYLTPKKRGQGIITLDQQKSRILANDGLGTKIEATFDPISFTIK